MITSAPARRWKGAATKASGTGGLEGLMVAAQFELPNIAEEDIARAAGGHETRVAAQAAALGMMAEAATNSSKKAWPSTKAWIASGTAPGQNGIRRSAAPAAVATKMEAMRLSRDKGQRTVWKCGGDAVGASRHNSDSGPCRPRPSHRCTGRASRCGRLVPTDLKGMLTSEQPGQSV